MASNIVSSSADGLRPNGALYPTIPHDDAGMRSEPPPSSPPASRAIPVATATDEPPDEPPLLKSRFHGLRVMS
ncbi:hypothetical protein QRX50_05850 [Amycolatopsis carbonis]|uniref:Uncharacterized protein n=1 Tax=Amycolatopsis carbonis TaxID=715471 RepID=A0A9Y2MYQ2_9PSEU|nr:hypothetical protein [Amycolatopsis sp. 2-15]WIX80304.1 hypothetical protein QRX50_05850 [Amycolatopsis sp. 2-15]